MLDMQETLPHLHSHDVEIDVESFTTQKKFAQIIFNVKHWMLPTQGSNDGRDLNTNMCMRGKAPPRHLIRWFMEWREFEINNEVGCWLLLLLLGI